MRFTADQIWATESLIVKSRCKLYECLTWDVALVACGATITLVTTRENVIQPYGLNISARAYHVARPSSKHPHISLAVSVKSRSAGTGDFRTSSHSRTQTRGIIHRLIALVHAHENPTPKTHADSTTRSAASSHHAQSETLPLAENGQDTERQ